MKCSRPRREEKLFRPAPVESEVTATSCALEEKAYISLMTKSFQVICFMFSGNFGLGDGQHEERQQGSTRKADCTTKRKRPGENDSFYQKKGRLYHKKEFPWIENRKQLNQNDTQVVSSLIALETLLWRRANARSVSQHTLYGVQHIHINLTLIHCTFV